MARIAQELALSAPALPRSSLAWHGGVRHGPGTGLSRAARASGPASRRRTDELAGKDSKQDCSSRLEKLRGSWKSTTLGRAGGATRRRSQSSRRRWLRCQSMWRCQSSRLWRRLPRYLQFSKFTLFRLFFRMFFLEHVLPRACSSGLFHPGSSRLPIYLAIYQVYLPIYQVSIRQQRYTSTAAIFLINSIFLQGAIRSRQREILLQPRWHHTRADPSSVISLRCPAATARRSCAFVAYRQWSGSRTQAGSSVEAAHTPDATSSSQQVEPRRLRVPRWPPIALVIQTRLTMPPASSMEIGL